MRGRNLTILLASPRGFCAGVERAIRMVEQALEDHGPPVYVRHEIVHNRHVVDGLRRMGAVFVEELDEVPDGAVVVFSAHGVPKRVVSEAARRGLTYADATCPLVTKIHREVERHARDRRTTLLIGHRGHPEVTGTMGQAPEGSVVLVGDVAQARTIRLRDPGRLAYATQTTLSISETEEIVAVLKERFPDIQEPRGEDICYATTNRQAAVSAIAPRVDLMLVLGAPNSSNSMRLVETALRAGCPRAALIEDAGAIDWGMLDGVARLGLTAGASAPESLVEGVVAACRKRYLVAIEEVRLVDERVSFKVPRTPLRRAS